MPFELPKLPYDPEALAPHMSAETFSFHHGKHHQAYVNKTNELAKEAGNDALPLVELIRTAQKGPLFNNAAQIWNHSFFWQCLSPEKQAGMSDVSKAIEILREEPSIIKRPVVEVSDCC